MPWSRLSRFAGDGRPPSFNRNPYNGDINPYYWVDDHPLLYGNNGSLDPGTCTLSKTHSHFAPENMPSKSPKRKPERDLPTIHFQWLIVWFREGIHTVTTWQFCDRDLFVMVSSRDPFGKVVGDLRPWG